MVSVGDRISVKISDADLGGTLRVGKGATMSAPGKIIQDTGDHWLVRLSISIGGKDQITIPKTAQR